MYIPIKVAFFDIDGTLVNSKGQISPQTVQAVSWLHSQGVKVALASGRPAFAAKAIMHQLQIKAASMFFAGALIYDPAAHASLVAHNLELQLLRELVQEIKDGGIHLELYTTDACYIEKRSSRAIIHEEYLGQPMIEERPEKTVEEREVLKIVMMAEKGSEEKRVRSLLSGVEKRGLSSGIAEGAGHPNLIFANITTAKASRDENFDFFLKHFMVNESEVAAFGDGEADMSFLRRSGFGVAMGNANHAVKGAARYTTAGVNEEGVSQAIRELFGMQI